MSYRNTLEAALESLHEIEDLVQGFPDDGTIPAIELDLSLQKIRNLYELLLMFRSPGYHLPAPGRIPVVETRPEPEVREPIPEVKAVADPPAASTRTTPVKPKGTGDAQIISDRFKGRSTLHETLHQTLGKDGSTLSHAKPVSNLMAAIGINDRFTFIRELFNNDTQAFENTMSILNEATNFNDAYNYMIQHQDWDMDSDAVQLLLEIIRRKYITGRHE
jgi:hypothetical protein